MYDRFLRKELFIDIHLDSNFIIPIYNKIKNKILLIKSINNLNVINFIDNILKNNKLYSLNLLAISMWLNMYKKILYRKSYLLENINGLKLYKWIEIELDPFIKFIDHKKQFLKNTENKKINEIINRFK